jgi:hypothetical protein
MSADKIIEFITNNPGAIASEVEAGIGEPVTAIEMGRLEAAGKVERAGTRARPGMKGRRPVQWVVPGATPEVTEDSQAQTGRLLPGAPLLPELTQEQRDAMDAEHVRQIGYIEEVFAGKHGTVKPDAPDEDTRWFMGRLKGLADRHAEIVKFTNRRIAAS